MQPEEYLDNCHFLPIDLVEEVMNNKNLRQNRRDNHCKVSLVHLQRKTHLPQTNVNRGDLQWTSSLARAVSAHDWDKVQTLLSQSPVWEHYSYGQQRMYSFQMDNYFRSLLLLLMYHPTAQAHQLLDQFMHMVLGIRTDEEKRAFMKMLVCIPDKLIKRGTKL